jgi:adsorption protein B
MMDAGGGMIELGRVLDFDFLSALVAYKDIIEYLAVILLVLFLAFGLDDLFVDLYYWFGKLRAQPQFPVDHVDKLDNFEPRPLAIMIPAWHESAVILQTLKGMQTFIRYPSYQIFVGVYPNDPATRERVEAAARLHSNIHLAHVPWDGPTSKADCLNAIIERVFIFERENSMAFAGVILHDAEDVVHPTELSLFNAALHSADLIQLPVFSFRRALSDVIAATYMDEFAEWHTRDLVVREHLTGIVTCAGVSACFSRRAIEALRTKVGPVFDSSNLTEDYDIAFRIAKLGMRERFVRFPNNFTVDISPDLGQPLYVERRLPVATREFFPDEFRAAYRQRARWLLGIVFQGWQNYRWQGTAGARYFLFRDRKAIVTSALAVLSLFVLANIAAFRLLYERSMMDLDGLRFDLLATPLATALIVANFLLLVNRLVHRAYFTGAIYGLKHGLLAGPRMLVSNLLNFYAALRAVEIFVRHLRSGDSIAWDKTSHKVPEQLRQLLERPQVSPHSLK